MNCEHDHCMCTYVGSSPCRNFTLLGVAHPFWDPHFRYREYADGRRSLEAAIVKKVELWLCNNFCKDVWNELVLACIFFRIRGL